MVLALLLQLALLLLLARTLGEIARRLGQPSVVGELLAGIILGPTLLGGLSPFVDTWLIPDAGAQGWLLEGAGLTGALFLLLITGMETDLALLRRHSRAAAGTSIGGITLPFVTGFVLGQYLPATLLGSEAERVVFALFIATAMSISAIPVIARVLMDLDLMRRDVGQTIIAAGMTDDAIGWTLLSVVAGLAAGDAVTLGSVGLALVRVIGFLVVSLTVGSWLVHALFAWVRDARGPFVQLSLVAGLMFGWAALAQALGLEAVFGAFVVGMILGREQTLSAAVHDHIAAISFGVFTPIFFGIAGLKVDARILGDSRLLGITLLVIAVATFGKVLGGYVGGRWIGGRDRWTSLAFGIGMNARGAMEIIIATVGLNLAIISRDMFSIIVVMAMATSLMAPPGLRWALRRVHMDDTETERLRRESLARASRVARIRRVLVPLRTRPLHERGERLEVALLDRLRGDETMEVTLFSAAKRGQRAEALDFLAAVEPAFQPAHVRRRVVEGGEPDVAILREARKSYDLLMLGARERATGRDALFDRFVDRVMRLAPCPTVVVQGRPRPDAWPPSRILVPVSGSQGSREAAELAFRLAGETGLVALLNVVPTGGDDVTRIATPAAEERRLHAAAEVVEHMRTHADAHGARSLPLVREGNDVESVVLDVAREIGAELIVLGTTVRAGSGRLFLGPRVERVLEAAACPVLVYNAAAPL